MVKANAIICYIGFSPNGYGEFAEIKLEQLVKTPLWQLATGCSLAFFAGCQK